MLISSFKNHVILVIELKPRGLKSCVNPKNIFKIIIRTKIGEERHKNDVLSKG